MSRFFALLALIASTFSVACGTKTEVDEKQATAVERGEMLFTSHKASPNKSNRFACATCHFDIPPADTSEIKTGAPLAGAPLRKTFWGGKENDLLRSVNDCRVYFMKAQEPWQPDDPDAQGLYAYLTSLESGSTDPVSFSIVQSVADLPEGDSANGADLFNRACKHCHGAAHSGSGRLTSLAPVLPEDTLAEHSEPEYTSDQTRLVFVEKVRHGGFLGYGGVMAPFSTEVLSDAELSDLLAFFGVY
jgi:thiosulfate dehydrogenase